MKKSNKSHRKPVIHRKSHQIIEPMQSGMSHEIMDDSNMQKPKKSRIWLSVIIIFLSIIAIVGLAVFVWSKYFYQAHKAVSPVKQVELTKPPEIQTGKIISSEPVQSFTAAQTLALIRQTNKAFNLPVNYGHKKQVIRFNTSDGSSDQVLVYARVYVPDNAVAGKTPVMINWTTGPRNVAHARDSLGIERVLTSRAFVDGARKKGVDLSALEDRFVYLEDLGASLTSTD